MLIKKIKSNFPGFLFFLLHTSLFLYFLWAIYSNFNQQIKTITLISTCLWILVCIFQIVINWREVNTPKIVNLEEKEEISIFSFENLSTNDKIGKLVTNFGFIITFIGFLSHDTFSESYNYTEQGYYLYSYGYIILAVALICRDIVDIFNIQSNIFRQVFSIFSFILILLGSITWLSSYTQLVEIIK